MTSFKVANAQKSTPLTTGFAENFFSQTAHHVAPGRIQPEPESYRSAFKLHQTISGSGDKKNDIPLPAKPKNWEKIEEKRRRCNDKVNKAFDECREKKLNDPKMKEFEKKSEEVMKKYEDKKDPKTGSLKPDDYRRRHNEIQALRYQYSDALRSCNENELIERKRCAEEYKREIEK